MTVTDPSIIAIYFYKRNGIGNQLLKSVVDKLSLTKLEETNDYKKYGAGSHSAEWIDYYDLETVRIVLVKKGDYQPAVWEEQKKFLSKIIGNVDKKDDMFVGASIIYKGFFKEMDESIQHSTIGMGLHNPVIRLSNKIGCGVLWEIGELKGDMAEYVFLSGVEEEILFARDWGIIRIDSHLHKGYNQIGLYQDARDKIMNFAKELNEEQLNLVRSLDKLNASEQKERLDAISIKYATFVEMISWVNTIQNTIQINISGYRDRWDQIDGNDGTILSFHIRKFKRAVEQIKHDLIYYNSILNGVQTSLEVLRSVNSADMQKHSLSLQGAVAIVELIFVFYYSLGIWHFLIGEEKWAHIASLDKAIVGLGLAFTLTQGSHFYFTGKNRNFYRICIAAAIVILIYAFLITNSIRVF